MKAAFATVHTTRTVPPRKSTTLKLIRVRRAYGPGAMGRVLAGASVIPCALGPAGLTHRKREGDGATPAGRYSLGKVLFRPDRIARPACGLPVRAAKPNDGWCDDARCADYNRQVRRPFAGSHEALWRDDALYDCLAVIDYNTTKIRKGRGSAIFLHIAAPGFTPTAGCVAIRRADLLVLLRRIGPQTRMQIA